MPPFMDFGAKYHSQAPLYLHDSYTSKPKDDDFAFERAFSSRGTNNILQDFNHIENFNLNSPTPTSNPIFSLQPTCFDTFDTTTFGCLPNIDFYESKPYGNHGRDHSALAPLMDNFTQSGGFNVLGHSQMMVTPISMISPHTHQRLNPFSYRDFSLKKSYKPPDESSCTSPKPDINMASKSFSTSMLQKRGRARKKKTNVVKGQWTVEEDRLLTELVERFGVRKWSQIADLLNGRIGKQCRERWHNHLRPDIKKDIWSEEDDRILIKCHEEIGNKWSEIAKKLPGRTENSIKNHWNATKRRQLSRRKCRSKYPTQSTLLQDYIKSLTPEKINAGCRKKHASATKTKPTIKNSNNTKSSNDQTGSFDSNSSNRLEGECDFSEVPDFNFDAKFFEDSSIDSLLDFVPIKEIGNTITCYDELQMDLGSMEQCDVKKELDLMEMISQVNF